MHVLLHGPSAPGNHPAARVLADRGHTLTVAATADETADALQADPPDMLVLLGATDDLIKVGRQLDIPDACLVVFVCENVPPSLTPLFEVGADDCIVASEPDRLHDRFAFIEQHSARPVDTPLASAHRQGREQAVVAEIGRRALAGTSVDVLMAFTVRAVTRALGVSYGKVLQYQPDRDLFVLQAGVGWRPGAVGTVRVEGGTHSQAGYTLVSSEPVVVEDVEAEERFEVPPLLAMHGIESGMSVAIPSTPEPYGVLGVHADTPRSFSSEDVYFLQSVANVLAGAVERTETEQALRESEAKARAILETTVDGIITIDADGIIESFNAAAEDIFGYDAEEVRGENVKVLMPSPYREEHDEYLRSYHETGRRKIIGIGREVTGLRKDGSTFPMDLAVSEVELGDRTLFTGIVRDISERRRLEKEILNISEQERRRIGQDLHDGLGQMLTGIGLLSQDLARQLEEEGHERADDMTEITELVKEADQYARDLSRGLTPVDLEASGLSDALRRLSQNAERMFDVRCTFEEVGTGLVHNSTAATHLYRISQESLSNAVRHGDADHVKITLAAGGEQIRLRVRDDGTGFEPQTMDEAGMGVRIMNYRARIIGGTLEVSSTLGDGTVVTCTVPRTAYPDEGESSESPESSSGGGGCPVVHDGSTSAQNGRHP